MTIDPQPQSDEPEGILIVADEGESRQSGSRVRAYLELIRAPAVFTALADVMLGFFFAYRPTLFDPQLPPTPPWALLVILLGASALLYTAGMALNDFFDAQVDARERPS